jgi:phosphatidylserine decarboxylase
MVVCVGAMMVGSVVITAEKGQKVRRTDELGYFKFGMFFLGLLLIMRWEYGSPAFPTGHICMG